mmetsp:Transcript_46120/g.112741  ORF Transcript_46120/g.112741 Transcript_46120/m.112741 type:complete len:221 (+) Transcript_46120:1281-1943(+)
MIVFFLLTPSLDSGVDVFAVAVAVAFAVGRSSTFDTSPLVAVVVVGGAAATAAGFRSSSLVSRITLSVLLLLLLLFNLLFNLLLLKNVLLEDENDDPLDEAELDVVDVAVVVDDDHVPNDFGGVDDDCDDFLNKLRPWPLLLLLLLVPDEYIDVRIFGITASNDEEPKIVATTPVLDSDVLRPLSVGPYSASSCSVVVNEEEEAEEEDIDASICCLLICM